MQNRRIAGGWGRRFKYLSEYTHMGMNIWDGTSSELRSEYAVDLSSHRLLQYDSCRGLEGWTVVNLEFDKFLSYKTKTYKEEETGELALETSDEKMRKFVNLWALIPMTRAIDTLVITLSDRNSEIENTLREVYESNPDFIEWIGE